MSVSFNQSHNFTCPLCHRPFRADLWFIVDTKERPDLVEEIQAETIHQVQCPNGHIIPIDAPLLLYRPHERYPLIFSPIQQTTEEQDREQLISLLKRLRRQLGSMWQDDWLENLRLLPRQALPTALNQGTYAEAAPRSGPHSPNDSEEPASFSEKTPLIHHLSAFIRARSWSDAKGVVEAHPDLLSEKAITFVEHLVKSAREQNDTDADIFEEHLAVLRHCREVGVAQAFAEKMRLSAPSSTFQLSAEVMKIFWEARAQTQHYLETNDPDPLDRAIALWGEILQPSGNPALPVDIPATVLNEAGSAYLHRHWVRGELVDLIQAITLWQEAVKRTQFASPERVIYLNHLGTGLSNRFMYSGNPTDLDQAIVIFQEAVTHTAPTSPNRVTYLNNLGIGLSNRFTLSGNPNDLDRAITVFQEAVEDSILTSPTRVLYLSNLGIGLSDRFIRNGNPDDLDRAITIFQEAVAHTEPASRDRVRYLTNLGIGLSTRFARSSNPDDLEQAIAVLQEAVERTPPPSPDRVIYLNNLGIGLSDRFALNNNPADLERAIAVFHEVVARTPSTSPDRVTYLNNLGNGLRNRYSRQGNPADLERVITVFEEVIERTPLMSPDRVIYLSNLGTGLSDRFARNGNPTDLERAIAVFEEAVGHTPPASPSRVTYLNNLGTALSIRFTQGSNPADLERATFAFQEACQVGLEVAPAEAVVSGRNWGNWALIRGDWEHASEAYSYSLEAIERLYASQSLLTDRERWLRELAEQPQRAAFALVKQGDLERAVTVLEQGRTRLLRESMERDVAELASIQAQAPALVAAYQRTAERVRTLERQERTDTSSLQASDLRYEVRAARVALEQAIMAIRTLPDHATFLLPPDFKSTLATVQPNAPLVYLLTTPAGSLILVITSTSGTRSHTITALWSEPFTLTVLNDLLVQRNKERQAIIGGYLPGQLGSGHELSASLGPLLTTVGEALITPLVKCLKQMEAHRVILVPAGRLALLPLHAAIHTLDGVPKNLLDDFEVAYAPSAAILQSLGQSTLSSRSPQRLTGVGNPLPGVTLGIQARDALYRLREPLLELQKQFRTQHPMDGSPSQSSRSPHLKTAISLVLMLTKATPEVILKSGEFLAQTALQLASFAPGVAHALATLALPLLRSLPHAKTEVQSITALFPQGHATAHYEAEATSSAIWQTLPHATIAHFACHGRFDGKAPLDSALFLASGNHLTLRDLFSSDPTTLSALQLVVLSACQTAISDFTTLPDEGLGLPAGFLQAGIPAVVGSLWSVNDFSTALLMVRFYELLLGTDPEETTAYSPAAALRMAQCWLRGANGVDLDHFIQRHPALQSAGVRWAEEFSSPPFDDPYYWAAFVFLGRL